MRAWVVPVLLASGCNEVWGLDGTRTAIDRTSDEDADGQPNVDDNCPGVINDSQSNADRDDAGDACDPNPGIRDRLLDEFYFNRPETDPIEWTPSMLVFEIGSAHAPVNGVHHMFAQETRDVKRVAVEAGITLTAYGAQDNKSGILLDGSLGHRCFVQRLNDTQARLWVAAAGLNPTGPFLPGPPDIGVQFRMVAQVDRTTDTVTCTVGSAVVSTVASTTATPGPIGLLAERDAVRFDYVLVWGAD